MAKFFDRMGRYGIRIVLTLTVLVILAPIVTTVLMSFSNSSSFTFPPPGFGLDQYVGLFTSPVWLKSIGLSLSLAAPAALLATAVALLTVIVAQRSKLPGRNALQGVAIAIIIIPTTALAVGLFGVYSVMGLMGTNLGLILAETVLAIPLAIAAISASLSRVPRAPEFAAMSAGATLTRAVAQITGRALVPAIAASAVMGFLFAFDEVVIVNFVGGPNQTTFPKAVFDSVQYSIDPVITAAATFLMLGSAVLMGLLLLITRLVSARKASS